MQIVIKSTTVAAETILCDGPDRTLGKLSGPLADGMEIDDQHEIQPVLGCRAPSMRFFDRGNGRVAFSWQSVHTSATSAAALLWQWGFHMSCVRTGDLYLIQDSTKILCPAAVLQLKSKPMGVTRVITFSVQSGVPRLA